MKRPNLGKGGWVERPLGKMQQDVLDLLGEHGEWHSDSGWTYGGSYRTKQILKALVRRGRVVVEDGVYSLTGRIKRK